MDNYFDSEIKRTNKEILNLKTSGQKSAVTVPVSKKTIDITVSLELMGSGNPRAYKSYRVETNSRALVFATLDKYFDDIMINDHRWNPDTRKARVYVVKVSKLVYYVNIMFIGDGNDYNVVSGGGTARMSRTLTVKCTDNFTMTEA